MKTAFNAASKVKDLIGNVLTLKGWFIFPFLAMAAGYAATAAVNPAALGVFEGAVASFLKPLVTASTYTEGVPALGTQLANTAVAAFNGVAGMATEAAAEQIAPEFANPWGLEPLLS